MCSSNKEFFSVSRSLCQESVTSFRKDVRLQFISLRVFKDGYRVILMTETRNVRGHPVIGISP